jgi:NADH-quinone oxidoreductase subunit G
MATIYIDGRPVEVDPRRNLLEVCLENGLNLPYFCWHPAMGSVGACRQCAVMQFKDEHDTTGKMVMSCMTPAADGTRISLEHPDAREMRKEVIEWLMTNHPHDCPVCEEGGECHLQDMTVMSGHNYRRYRETKRTHQNQYLGPFIGHEMNRCISCYRCVRFYQDYAGGKDLSVFASRNNVYFGRAEDGVLENEFSGNLVEVCPTGVFTDKTLSEHYSRKWDLQTAPSVCTHCGVGCNTSPGERYGRLKRITNRYHGDINSYFICDRGRFGYGFVNREDRPVTPLVRQNTDKGGALQSVYRDEAMQVLAPMLAQGQRVLGIGSPRASLESNFALRQLVGAENFSSGLSSTEHKLLRLIADIHARGMAHVPSLREAEQADAILVLGEDVSNTAPRLALSLRQALRQKSFEMADKAHIPHWQDAAVRTLAQQARSPLFVLTSAATRLDEIATQTHQALPEMLARIGQAIAHALDTSAPAASGLGEDALALVQQIALALKDAKRPLIVSGPSCGSAAIIQAAANIARALNRADRPASLCVVTPEANSLGAVLLGGMDMDAALASVRDGKADTLVVLENDLYRRAPVERVDAALSGLKQLIVLDHLNTPTVQRAHVVLPAGSFAEADGTWINYEGRAQRAYQTYAPDAEGPLADVQESWRWLQETQTASGHATADWKNLDAVTQDCAHAVPALARIVEAAPSAAFRRAGQKQARQSHRYSGRTAMRANVSVHEPRPVVDADSPLSFSMDPADAARVAQQGRLTEKALADPTTQAQDNDKANDKGNAKANVVPLVWMPGWNSNQAITKFQDEINGHLRGGDPGVRLFDSATDTASYFMLDAAATGEGLRALPLYYIFGSEELSAKSSAVAERMPANHVALNARELARLGVQAGHGIRLSWDGNAVNLPVQLNDSLPDGGVGLPQGLPGMPVIDAPRVRVEKA